MENCEITCGFEDGKSRDIQERLLKVSKWLHTVNWVLIKTQSLQNVGDVALE